MRVNTFGILLAGASMLAMGGIAAAQSPAATAPTDAPPGGPSQTLPGSSTGVSEVVVTAQRRAERLQTVPIAVTAINAKILEQAGIEDLTRLQVLTPGFTVGKGGEDSEPALRGVATTNSRLAGADAAVAYFADGVYQAANEEAMAPFVDVARVEVERGPQGTLFGRNSFGGNVDVVSNLPSRTFGGSLSAEAGNYGENRFEGVLNLPISDTLQVRLAGLADNSDGYIKNLGPAGDIGDNQTTYLRGTIRWDPTSKFHAVLRTNYWDEGGRGGSALEYKVAGTLVNPAQPYNADGSLNQELKGVPIGLNPRIGSFSGLPGLDAYPDGVPVVPGAWTIDTNTPAKRRIEQYATTLDLSYDFDFATLRSITAYNDFDSNRVGDSDFTQYALTREQQITHTETTTEELQLASNATKPFQWIIGGYFLRTNASEVYDQFRFTANKYSGDDIQVFDTNSYAGYAQASYDITNKLRLTGGVRYTEDHKTASGYDYVAQSVIANGARDFYRVTYRGAIDYQLTPDDLLYASVSNGFSSGGFNAGITAPLPPTFGPESVTAYEIGAKTQFFEKRLQANFSVFYNAYNDLQVTGFDETTFLTYVVNTGSLNAKGVEAEFTAVPVKNLNVIFNVAYLNAYFSHFSTVDPITYAGYYKGDGNQQAQSPEIRIGLAADYTFDLGRFGTLTPHGDTRYTSSYYLTALNTALDYQPKYFESDLRLTWIDQGGHYSVEAYVNNLENVAVKSSGEIGGYGAYFISYEPPRMYGLKVNYKF